MSEEGGTPDAEMEEAPPVAPRYSGRAIASFVCGLLSFACPVGGFAFGPTAIIYAIIGRIDIDRSKGLLLGRGFTVAGLILGILGTALTWGVIVAFAVVIRFFHPEWYTGAFPH